MGAINMTHIIEYYGLFVYMKNIALCIGWRPSGKLKENVFDMNG